MSEPLTGDAYWDLMQRWAKHCWTWRGCWMLCRVRLNFPELDHPDPRITIPR
jgi:hypothetical protein